MLKVRTESKVFTQKQMLKRDFFPPSSELALSLRNNQFSEWRNSELHSEITQIVSTAICKSQASGKGYL